MGTNDDATWDLSLFLTRADVHLKFRHFTFGSPVTTSKGLLTTDKVQACSGSKRKLCREHSLI